MAWLGTKTDIDRELKQQRRCQLELILIVCTLLLVLFKPEKENSCPVFMSSTKREIRHFTSTSCNDGREMYKIV